MNTSIDGLFKNTTQMCDEIIAKDDINLIMRFIRIILVTGGVYGFTMGLYNSILQAFVSMAKVPFLFFVTLIICIPTLHFMGLLLGSKLRFLQSATILLWALAITSILLSAFAPISLFFMLSHSGYSFIMIMHVSIFAICGLAGLRYVSKNFRHVAKVVSDAEGVTSSANPVLLVWMLLYMFVGCQMAYILSPFVGSEQTFLLFNGGEYNFFTYLLQKVLH